MKFLLNALPFAALATAFVLPPEQVLADIAIEDHHDHTKVDEWLEKAASTKDDLLDSFKQHFDEITETSKHAWSELSKESQNALDEAFAKATEKIERVEEQFSDYSDEVQSWLEDSAFEDDDDDDHRGPGRRPDDDDHHGPPGRRPSPHHQEPDHKEGDRKKADHKKASHKKPDHKEEDHKKPDHKEGDRKKPGHKKPGHKKPPHHKKPHHPKSNQTVWELIASSKYTTKLAKLVGEYDDLVEALNSTKANYTIFAPTDKAFEKIPDHAPKPSKEFLKAVLSYHVVPDIYPAGRVLATHTVPTLLKGEHLSSQPEPQRLTFKIGLRGLTVNFYSRIIAANIFGTNGVIHGVDSLLIPPPSVIKIIDLFPGEFSTLELGLGKTGLLEKLNNTDHAGGTFFAPSNFAFKKLGPKINAFLFSSHGEKYLKALLEYHVVPGVTLYSDAIYKSNSSKIEDNLPSRGHFQATLPTLLKDRSLSVDIARFGRFITIKINGFSPIAVQDAIAEDGVIHVVRNVLIPPRKLGSAVAHWDGEEELSVVDLTERLEPFVAKSGSKFDL